MIKFLGEMGSLQALSAKHRLDSINCHRHPQHDIPRILNRIKCVALRMVERQKRWN